MNSLYLFISSLYRTRHRQEVSRSYSSWMARIPTLLRSQSIWQGNYSIRCHVRKTLVIFIFFSFLLIHANIKYCVNKHRRTVERFNNTRSLRWYPILCCHDEAIDLDKLFYPKINTKSLRISRNQQQSNIARSNEKKFTFRMLIFPSPFSLLYLHNPRRVLFNSPRHRYFLLSWSNFPNWINVSSGNRER